MVEVSGKPWQRRRCHQLQWRRVLRAGSLRKKREKSRNREYCSQCSFQVCPPERKLQKFFPNGELASVDFNLSLQLENELDRKLNLPLRNRRSNQETRRPAITEERIE